MKVRIRSSNKKVAKKGGFRRKMKSKGGQRSLANQRRGNKLKNLKRRRSA